MSDPLIKALGRAEEERERSSWEGGNIRTQRTTLCKYVKAAIG